MVAVPGLTFGNSVLCLSSAKLDFERRLSRMSEERWARQTFKCVHLWPVPTRWVRRTRQLAHRYEVSDPFLYIAAEQPELQQSIRGMLWTRVLRAKCMDVEVKCVMCAQGADETAEHVIMEC
ncbi:unnamed protein product, partial [Ixodes pacificus]